MENTIIRKKEVIAPIPTFTKVAAYARVSSGKDEMLHSLAAQVSYFTNYIRKHFGWAFAGVYVDEAMTGTKNNRPDFRRMIEDCRTGKVDLILTKSISRFARNTVDLLETVRELKALEVDVYFEEQNIHTISGEGELMLSILAAYAEEESLSVSENCKWRIRKRFENGELANLNFMYGYRVTRGKIEIDLEQAAIVRAIFQDYVAGMSGLRIASKLRELKIPTERGGTWDSRRVLNMLKNEKYTGNALLQKKYVMDHLTKRLIRNNGALPMYQADGTHPAIIDQDIFNEAQALLKERLKSCGTRSDVRNTYSFSSIISCGHCGKHFRRTMAKGKATWKCATYLVEGKAACKAKGIPEETLKAVIAEVLGLTVFDDDCFLSQIMQIVVQEANRLVFVFRDGHTEERVWLQRSRRESWTDEMKQVAKEYANRRKHNGDER